MFYRIKERESTESEAFSRIVLKGGGPQNPFFLVFLQNFADFSPDFHH